MHQRDVLRVLQEEGVDSPSHFAWVSSLRYSPLWFRSSPASSVQVKMANACFDYSFEYLEFERSSCRPRLLIAATFA